MPMPPDVESYLRSLAHRFNEPDLRKAADEIEALRAELEKKEFLLGETLEQLRFEQAEAAKKGKRIEELHEDNDALIAQLSPKAGCFFTDEQIDAAWKQSGYYTRSHAEGMKHALLLLGIVACEECGGRGSWNERTNNITVIQRNCPTCAKFSGHGWVVK